MGRDDFVEIRKHLGKTQKQMAQLLLVSLKAVKSYEQGWRNIPSHIERQVLYLLAAHEARGTQNAPCWEIKNCPMSAKENCPAWEFQAGQFCWFINGVICEGKVQKSWTEKMKICRQCKIARTMLPLLFEKPS